MRVKATISIKERTFIVQSQVLEVLKEAPDGLLEIIAVIMVACQQSYQADNVPVPVNCRQNIAGLRFLSPLVGDTFAPFFAIV